MKALSLVWVAALACALLAAPVLGSLGSAAAGRGRYFGTAIAGYRLTSDATYAQVFDDEFTSAVCENEMKWDATEWNQNQFTFSGADTIVNHARAHNMQVRGHTLVWHAQLPQWVKDITNPQQLLAVMNNHITRVAQYYAGKIYAWDVVNEAFDDGGNGMRNAADSVFTRVLGNNYNFIETAFRTAHAADPNAKLCYNDYGTEGQWPKTNNIYNMVADFKARGVPIDCVGFQTHLGSVPSDFQANLQRFANLGVDVQITELDVGGSGQTQANTYAAVVNACLGVSRCTGITVWGITDKYSWRSSETPLLFDSNFGKKQAYYSVINAFGAPTTCTAPAPSNPANGHFACASSGAACAAICDEGYGATGTGITTCSGNAWSPLPACVPSGAGASACGLASEGSAVSLSCASGQLINTVEFASYGQPQGTCAASGVGACHASSSLSVLEAACVGKASCSVSAANSVFGDPCPGTGKQLAVRAHCAAATTTCASGSEWATLTLSCPAGKNINGISFASYGTPSGSCSAGFASGSCHAGSSLDVVQKACMGKNTCSFAGGQMNAAFGDPCSGTGKTLAIQALCG